MKTKYIIGVFLFIFWTAGAGLITAGLLSYEKSKQPANLPASATNAAKTIFLTVAEVAKHNTATDCWSIINNKVYNLTSLISGHSGGTDTILRNCGKDGTIDFDTKDQTPAKPHSKGAEEMMQSFYIGDIGASIITTDLNAKIQTINLQLKNTNMKGYVTDLEQATLQNKKFRVVLYTAKNSQLVLMSLAPNEDIGEEVHDLDQFIRVEAGMGKAVLNGVEHNLSDGFAVVIPAGTKHNIINTSPDTELKLYTVYSPPEHLDGVERETKAEAMASEEHFDGKTSE